MAVGSPSMISGLRGTGNINSALRKLDYANVVSLVDPNNAPLVRISMQLASKRAGNPQFGWFEDEFVPGIDTVATATTAAATSLVVTTGGFFRVGDVWRVARTGEVFYVSAIATNTLTITRSIGSTVAAAVVVGDVLVNTGQSLEEGSSKVTPRTTQVASVQNFCQIFRTGYGVTNTEKASDLYSGPDLPRLRDKAAAEHTQRIEAAFIFGEQSEITTGTHPRRTTQGILEFLGSTNTLSANDGLTLALFQDWLRRSFRYGSTRKVIFAGNKFKAAFDLLANERLRETPKGETFGIRMQRFLSSVGDVDIVHEPVFSDISDWSDGAVLLDLDDLMLRYMDGRKMRHNVNIQNPDTDGEEHEWLSEVGLELRHPDHHGTLRDAGTIAV